jgi:serine/threonine protein kinase
MDGAAKPSREDELRALQGMLSGEALAAVHAWWLEQGVDPELDAAVGGDSLMLALRDADSGIAELERLDSAYDRLADDVARRTGELQASMLLQGMETDTGDETAAGETPQEARDSVEIAPGATQTLSPVAKPVSTPATLSQPAGEVTFLSNPAVDENSQPQLTSRDGNLATPTEAELVPGFQLGAYRIVKRLGQGGMGSVFLAEHIRMERLVALKTLSSVMTRDPQAVKRFHREVKAAAKLTHANIVTAYDADEARGLQMLIMEYVDGTDLSVRVKKDGPMPLREAVDCVLQAARGLEFAHGKGVVHRDIKPANLLIDKAGVVKVLDMGLARIGEFDETAAAGLTSTGTIMGTAEFMAPEQALDTRTAGAPADIYSLGCTLHYLLTGKAPFTGDTVMKILLAHRDRAVPKLGDVRADAPDRLDALFQRMVAKRVEDRCQTMGEVIAELEAIRAELLTGSVLNPGSGPVSLAEAVEEMSRLQATAPTRKQRLPVAMPVARGAAPPARKFSRGLTAAAGAAAVILFGLVITLKTREGKLILKVDDADVTVEVDEKEEKFTVTDKEGKTLTIGVDPGKHKLVVRKGGFKAYSNSFEIGWGGTQTLSATLEPLDADKGVASASTPSPGAGSTPVSQTDSQWDTPEFRQWLAEVKDLPAAKLLEAVSKKMVELNPGFDGKLAHPHANFSAQTPVIERGKVVEVGFASKEVTNLAPLRALGTLRSLVCVGTSEGNERGRLSDLTPLRGMEIERFYADWNPLLRDISPVVGPRLRELWIDETGVTDLSPLRGSAVTILNVALSGVTDIRPLAGLPLETLNLSYYGAEGGVTDLSPLQGMPLKKLGLRMNIGLTDISGLAGLPLTSLDLLQTGVESLEPLRGMRLTTIAISATKVSDMSPLKTMPLRTIELDFDAARDTQWLRSIKTLESINGKPAAEFWKEVAAMSATSPKPAADKDTWDTPEFRKWLAEVKDLPARELVEAVEKKLAELNPGFDGKLSHPFSHIPGNSPVIERGRVVEVGFSSQRVSNIAPLRAFGKLRALSCAGSSDPGQQPSSLIDISPLRGMEIERLAVCWNQKLSDISPVVWPGLHELLANDSKVADLTPLRGTPLRKLLVDFSGVVDLSPLEGMPLEELGVSGDIGKSLGVTDLSPLKGMKLRVLSIAQNSSLSDISALAGMPLDWLVATGTIIDSLEPLRGMKIRQLALIRTRVTDLSPLKGMPLIALELASTPVSDLTPLQGLPLTELQLSDCDELRDCSPLKEMSLKRVFLDFDAERDTEWLRSLKELEQINGKPVAEFWTEVDEK